MASDCINIDTLIEDLGGCGQFQVLMAVFTSWVRIVGAMSMIMMAYGNYNPGWQCLDNSTTPDWNGANLSMTTPTTGYNDTDECHFFEACHNVQFTPGISTVVSEWQLVCDRSWLSSLIISIQMVGVLLGSYLSGYLGDKIGRKRTLCTVTFYHLVVNVIAIFSNSWYMFAVMRFLIGIAIPVLVYTPIVLTLEFVPQKWRASILALPTFSIGCTIAALCAMATKDWKYLHIINAIASLISLLPFFWIPDSLRWLVVKDKMKDASAVVKCMAKLNGKEANETEALHEVANLYKCQPQSRDYSGFQLLSQLLRKGVRYPTFVIGIFCVSMSMVYYVINFGVKSMPGNFFTNLIILSCADIPIAPISSVLPNYTGRKIAIIIFLAICTMSLFTIVGLDLGAGSSLKSIGILVNAVAIRMTVEAAWDIVVVYTGEIFPTFMRGTSIAYTSCSARIGGILSPFLIPDNPDTHFINYLIMALCAFICCILVIFLQETKGKPLQDVWQEDVMNPEKEAEAEKDTKRHANCDTCI